MDPSINGGKPAWPQQEQYGVGNHQPMPVGYVAPAPPPPYSYAPPPLPPPAYAQPQPTVFPVPPGATLSQPGLMLPGVLQGLQENVRTEYPRAVNPLGVPLGCLAHVDQIFIRQEIDLLNVAFNAATGVRFDVLNGQSQLMFRAEDLDESCGRGCASGLRALTIRLTAPDAPLGAPPVMTLRRPFRSCLCCALCLPCLLCLPCVTRTALDVEAPEGFKLGRVSEDLTMCFQASSFNVTDQSGRPVFRVQSKCCPGIKNNYVGRDVDFEVFDVQSNQQVGLVSKQWSGTMQEAFTRSVNFRVAFPAQLSLEHKALLMAVPFLFKFIYFDAVPVQHQERHHHHGNN